MYIRTAKFIWVALIVCHSTEQSVKHSIILNFNPSADFGVFLRLLLEITMVSRVQTKPLLTVGGEATVHIPSLWMCLLQW